MTMETLVTITIVAWLLGIFTIKDIVNGIKEFKAVRNEIANTGCKSKEKKQWDSKSIEAVLRKLEREELKKRYDEGRYNGEWLTIAEKILKEEKKEEKSDV